MPTRESVAGTDRVLRPVRWLAAFILPFLLIAATILVFLPGRIAELFAWPIRPPLTGMILGSAYIGGIIFFAAVLRTGQWHRVRRGFLPVLVFAGLLGIATALHEGLFTRNLSFFAWAVLYASTPFLVAAAALAQRRADPRLPGPHDVLIPDHVARALVGVGGVATLTGLVMFLFPALFIQSWGWDLTPLTARTLGAVLSLTGFVNAPMVVDRRWSSYRVLFAAQLVSLVFILASVAVGSSDVHWERPAAWAFVTLVLLALVSYGALTLWAELRLRRAGASAGTTAERFG
ncbi:hypothetical protein [Arthrobacter sp. Cr_A7]|uniref:hypothetical protein n=1 Tax=Arthrobacter sp. Cr_A7 TaxID=3031017 RepID=UPI0023DA7231|nr:hypothetical protein [Arthrobacter sp. Cr_A7]MDF2049525.1 hypothetical protein [Arthrobacter sp. Cr_A7]